MRREKNAGDSEEITTTNGNVADESAPLLPNTRKLPPQPSPAKSEQKKIERENDAGEIENSTTNTTNAANVAEESSPLLADTRRNQSDRSVRTSTLEVEVHLFLCGEGPIDVFKSSLGGWDQNQLEIRQILEKYGLKMVYGFNAVTGRGVPIRFNPKNGRSILPYTDGAVIFVDAEPKDSVINPITRIVLWIVFITLLIVMFMNETPTWAKKMNLIIVPNNPSMDTNLRDNYFHSHEEKN